MTDQFDTSLHADANRLDPSAADPHAAARLQALVSRTDAFAKRTKSTWTIAAGLFAVLTVGRVAGAYGDRPADAPPPPPVTKAVKKEIAPPPAEVVPVPEVKPAAAPEPEPAAVPAAPAKKSKAKAKSKKKAAKKK